MAVDPGGTTGLAYGIFDAGETLRETLLSAENVEALEVYGEPVVQSWTIAELWLDFAAEANLSGVAVGNLHLVFEAFDVRTVLAELSPVEVIAGVRTLLVPRGSRGGVGGGVGVGVGVGPALVSEGPSGPPPWTVDWRSQTAGAKGWATSERLKSWDLYALGRGSEHKRDALRHLAVRVRRILDGKV